MFIFSINLNALAVNYENSVFISVHDKSGIEEFYNAIEKILYQNFKIYNFILPVSRQDLTALIHRTGKIITEDYFDSKVRISALVSDKTLGILKKFVVN